jgi:hypothetical protein
VSDESVLKRESIDSVLDIVLVGKNKTVNQSSFCAN